MNKTNLSFLLKELRKPVLYERTSEPFWADEYISKQMLKAHLDNSTDAASRKIEFINESVKWLNSLIKPNSKILDIGCGPGLYTSRLVKLGHNVLGIDISKNSINYAKNHDNKSEYIVNNYLEMDYNNEFDLIILIYCDFTALTKDERLIILKKVEKALKPNGLFIFDCFTINHFNKIKPTTNWHLDHDGFFSSGDSLVLEATYLYEENTILVDQYLVVTDKQVKKYLIWDTAFSINKLNEEMKNTNLKLEATFSDVCGKTYNEHDDTICFVLKKE